MSPLPANVLAILLTDPSEVADVADWLRHEAHRRGPEGVAQSEVDAGFPGFDRASVAAGVERACRLAVELDGHLRMLRALGLASAAAGLEGRTDGRMAARCSLAVAPPTVDSLARRAIGGTR
jgi:hypothetical protein